MVLAVGFTVRMSVGDPRKDAERYLRENKVKELFKELGTKLMFERPTDPNACVLRRVFLTG